MWFAGLEVFGLGFGVSTWLRVCSFGRGTSSEPTALGLGVWVLGLEFWDLGFGSWVLGFGFEFWVSVFDFGFGSEFAENLLLIVEEPARSLQGYLAHKKLLPPATLQRD